jgi:hypothetical protein
VATSTTERSGWVASSRPSPTARGTDTVRPYGRVSDRCTAAATHSTGNPGDGGASPSSGAAPRDRASHSVRIGPGFTLCTRTPRVQTSRRSPSTNPSTAYFVDE